MNPPQPQWLTPEEVAARFRGELPTVLAGRYELSTSDGRWVAELAGVVYALEDLARDTDLDALFQDLPSALDGLDGNSELAFTVQEVHHEWGRQARARRRPLARLVTVLTEYVVRRYVAEKPMDIAAGLDELLAGLPARWSAHRSRVATFLAAWIDTCLATDRLLVCITCLFPMRRELAGQVRAQANAWLRWTHGLRASDGAVGATKMGWLLLTLGGGNPRALWDVRELDEALSGGTPETWHEVLARLVMRGNLTPDHGSPLLVRAVPVAKLVRGWARVQSPGPDTERLDAAGWLGRCARELTSAARRGWEGVYRPAARFEVEEGRTTPLFGEQRASTTSALLWASDIVAKESVVARTARQRFPPAPELRTSLGLAFLINQDAENFASRVMPSLELWPCFRWTIARWLEPRCCPSVPAADCLLEHVEDAPCAMERRSHLHQARWRVYDGDSPWTGSRLCRHMVRDVVRRGPTVLAVGRYLDAGGAPHPAVGALVGVLHAFLGGVLASPRPLRTMGASELERVISEALHQATPLAPASSATAHPLSTAAGRAAVAQTLTTVRELRRPSIGRLIPLVDAALDSSPGPLDNVSSCVRAFVAGFVGGSKMGLEKARSRERALR